MKEAERLADLFKALANPLRLRILALCAARERTSTELRRLLGVSKPLLIAHLKKLLKHGLLEYRVVVDEKRLVIRKLYRVPDDLEIRLDKETLRRLAETLEGKERARSA